MRLHFPRIGLLQFSMEKKSWSQQNSHGLPVYHDGKSRPPFHPKDELVITKRMTSVLTLVMMPAISQTAYNCMCTGSTRGYLQGYLFASVFCSCSEEMSTVTKILCASCFLWHLKLMPQFMCFDQNWLEDQMLMNNTSGTALDSLVWSQQQQFPHYTQSF